MLYRRRENAFGSGIIAGSEGVLLFIVAAASVVKIAHSGREKFIGGEVDLTEQLARVVGRGDAFLIRDAEVIGRNQHGYVAYNLYNGKNTDGSVNNFLRIAAIESTVQTLADFFRQAAATGFAAAARFANSRGKTDRIRNLNNCFGYAQGGNRGTVAAVFGVFGGKHFYVAVTAVKNYFFVEYAGAVNCGARRSRPHQNFQPDFKEKGHVHRVEAAVKGHWLQIYIGC